MGGKLRKYVRLWGLSTEHFDPTIRRVRGPTRARPLDEILVDGSTYARGHLKRRLYEAGLKKRRCELCGQGEAWLGRRMSLILDHINGRADDHRLDNLRIVCPNCAATLDTHCGRNLPRERRCKHCGNRFSPTAAQHHYCSKKCGQHSSSGHAPRPLSRKGERPPYERLKREIAESSYLAVGCKYGVSDNAVRKWIRWYEREAEEAEAA